jgi:virginiamycin B lyase
LTFAFATALALLAGLRPAATQLFTEYTIPTAGSDPLGVTAGPDGAVWFTEQNTNKIGRITTSGVITEFAIPTSNSVPYGITTAGPDGALWFVEEGGNNIGRITTPGVITEYPIPTAKSGSKSITVGSDGALWFTEVGKIGRITTSGAITEFPTLSNGFGITAGADGALWFTQQGALDGTIGRITTAGVVTDFPGGAAQAPTAITTGPDGALWFIVPMGMDLNNQPTPSQIGRITTAGVVTIFPLPAGTGVVPNQLNDDNAITTGPKGSLWFTGSEELTRITRQGIFTEFGAATFAGGTAIVEGPDGALLFAVGNNIVRYVSPITGTHDFNADGMSDILWRDTNGNTAIWLMDGANVSSSTNSGVFPPSGKSQDSAISTRMVLTTFYGTTLTAVWRCG